MADDNCPGCGGVLEQEGVDVAYVTDIPAMPRPQVTEYRGRCIGVVAAADGYEDATSRLVRTSYGASAHRMGRRVMAAAQVLHYGVSIPVRRVPSVLRALTGVESSQSESLRTHCAESSALWEMRTRGSGSRCVRARWCTQTTRAGE